MDLIESGHYRARALQAELGKTGTGKEQVVVRFELLDPPYAGRTIVYYGVMTEKTEKWVVKGLVLCGWDGESETFAGITRNVVSIEIEQEADQQGNPRNRVRWINDPNASLVKKPMEAGERAVFFSRIRGRAELAKAEIDARPSAPSDIDDLAF